MRHLNRLALPLALAVVLTACAEDDSPPLTSPTPDLTTETGGPGLAIYGVGMLQRDIPRPCPDPEYREFDFWVGLWNVENPSNQLVATSVITRELDGCVIMEDYIGNTGFRGRSMNVYDSSTDTWYQSFQDNIIGNFRISGGLVGAEMVMTGSQLAFDFPTQSFRQRDSRLIWTPLAGGQVRQVIESSLDGGPFATTFDGLYIPQGQLDRADPAFFPFCQSVIPGFRQLDFWLGSWSVAAAAGPALGISEVTSELNGCLIEENFETPRGYKNRSFVFYDWAEDTWFRTLADNAGEHVELSGGLENGKMVLTGTDVAPNGREVHLKVTIESVAPGQVQQTWELSHDGGATWKSDLTLVYTQGSST